MIYNECLSFPQTGLFSSIPYKGFTKLPGCNLWLRNKRLDGGGLESVVQETAQGLTGVGGKVKGGEREMTVSSDGL